MKLKKFFNRSYLMLLCFLLVILAVVFLWSLRHLRQVMMADQVNELTELALALSVEIAGYEAPEQEPLQKMLYTQARISRTRVTLIDITGRVSYDSEGRAEEMESHRYRPEITAALVGEVFSTVRYSDTLGRKMLYVAVPVRKQDEVTAVCRVSRPLKLAVGPYLEARNRLVITLLILFIAGSLVLFFLVRTIQRPLDQASVLLARAAAGAERVSLGPFLVSRLEPLAADLNLLLEKMGELSQTIKSDREVFRTFIDSSDEGWLLVDQNGRIILMNRSLREMFPEISPDSEFFWQSLRRPELHELVHRARQSAGPVECQLEKGGRTYSCLSSWLPGRQNYLIKFRDITETRELNLRKKEFVANLAHELKTPLTAISGFLETLEEEKLSPEGRGYLDIIKRNTARLVRLVEDLARLSELEEKGLELDKAPLDLAAVVRGVVEAYQKEANNKGLYLKLEAEPLPLIAADAFQIEQLIINLVDNAIRYTEKGGVVVALKPEAGGVLLSVTDTGIGIPEEHLPRIFERFYVVDKSRSRRTGGTGLGLSIVKHIVLAHGGKIEVKSAPGFGSSFTVWLPVQATDSQPA
ncbi:MAG: Phosphate regulon sensor protein PhoR (SphS) [Candidatus Saccharicenans subterraneus]|uniref:histidine kinase n=1 Tax=Candidatus Saccharicenans subterraneus TaxID=2508984 RepID=A0A3E2BN52_9BACT|nr:MAG: Phosphate regulon sensor protein PhoR (SphS) [Candidatus Saccharicenans subterraneum]